MAPQYGLPVKYADDAISRQCEQYDNNLDNGSQTSETRSEHEDSDVTLENCDDPEQSSLYQSSYTSSNKFTASTRTKENIELNSMSAESFPDHHSNHQSRPNIDHTRVKVFRGQPAEKYMWNTHILEGLREIVHPDWVLNIIHGFVGQSSIFFIYTRLILLFFVP